MIGKQLQFGIFYEQNSVDGIIPLSSRRERLKVKNGIWQFVVFTILRDKVNSVSETRRLRSTFF